MSKEKAFDQKRVIIRVELELDLGLTVGHKLSKRKRITRQFYHKIIDTSKFGQRKEAVSPIASEYRIKVLQKDNIITK